MDNGRIIFDMFNIKNNKFIASLSLPSEIINKNFKITDNIISVIDTKENNMFYKEYRIKILKYSGK